MVEAKHEFIDDNPYIVYSPDAEATASGSGGGGGFPVVEMNIETGALSVTAGELAEMMDNSPVIVNNTSFDANWQFISTYEIAEGTYTFYSLSVAPDIHGTASFVSCTWIATSADGYPVYPE